MQVEVDRPAQADELLRQRRGPDALAGAVVEHDHASDHAGQLRRQPDVLAVAVRGEELRRERVEVGEQKRGLGVLAVDHIRRERQVALDADDAQLLRRGQRLGREDAHLVPEPLEVLGDRDQIGARLERLGAEEDLHAPIIASARAHHPGGHAHHERSRRHITRDDRACRYERLLADLDSGSEDGAPADLAAPSQHRRAQLVGRLPRATSRRRWS